MNKIKFSLSFLMFLLICNYFSIEFVFFVSIMYILYKIFIKKLKFSITKLPGFFIYLMLFILGICIGTFYLFTNKYIELNFIKHIVYFLLVFLFWIVGQLIIPDNLDEASEIKYIYLSGVYYCFIDLLFCTIKLFNNGILNLSLYNLRSIIGTDTGIALITLFISVYFLNGNEHKKMKLVTYPILVFDTLIHFSRMGIIIFAILILFSGTLKNYKKIIKLIIIFFCTFYILQLISPNLLNEFIRKINNSISEAIIIGDNWNHTNIVNNWRNYETFRELQHFNDVGLFSKIFGEGFGSTLKIGSNAFLITDSEYIPFFHNGYATILMVWGISGIIIYFVWIIYMFIKFYMKNNKISKFISAILIIVIIQTYFMHGPFFNIIVASEFIYLSLFYKLLIKRKRERYGRK